MRIVVWPVPDGLMTVKCICSTSETPCEACKGTRRLRVPEGEAHFYEQVDWKSEPWDGEPDGDAERDA